MTKLEAWKKWCEQVAGMDATEYTLEKSSHGKAFTAGWDFAVEECVKVLEEKEGG